MKKHGVILDCNHCCCVATDNHGKFDVTVPINDTEADIAGLATIHGTISLDHHSLNLVELRDNDCHVVKLDKEKQKHIAATLDFVADKHICGNSRICPHEIVKIAKKNQ